LEPTVVILHRYPGTLLRIALLSILVLLRFASQSDALPGRGIDWATFIGGLHEDEPHDIVTDAAGYVYVTGHTYSEDLPVTAGACDTTHGGSTDETDVFIAKLSPDGKTLIWLTYLGGSKSDTGWGLAVAANGEVIVAGDTNSPDFPTTPGAFQSDSREDSDAFVLRLKADGSGLVWSTRLGGSGFDGASDLALGADESVYLAGITWSADFPTTPGAFQTSFSGGAYHAFAARLKADGSALEYGTFLAGKNYEEAYGIAVSIDGRATLCGYTYSPDFPTTPGAFDTTHNGGYYDAFVTRLNPDGSALEFSTLIGAEGYDVANGLCFAPNGEVLVAGWTDSTHFPTTINAAQRHSGGARDGFVLRLSPDGSSLVSASYVGGSGADYASSIGCDSSGIVWASGSTHSSNFPLTSSAIDGVSRGGDDAWVAVWTPDGTRLIFSTLLGGTADDYGSRLAVVPDGVLVTGDFMSPDAPVTPNAFDTTWNGHRDIYIARLRIPGTWLETVRALQTAGGLYSPTPSEISRWDVVTDGRSSGRIDLSDAVSLARAASGL